MDLQDCALNIHHDWIYCSLLFYVNDNVSFVRNMRVYYILQSVQTVGFKYLNSMW